MRRRAVADSLVVWPAPGRPAEAVASVGRKLGSGVAAQLNLPALRRGRACVIGPVTASGVAAVAGHVDPDRVAVHPAVQDAGRLALARPVDDDRLRPYQREVVGMHLTTTIGFVNSLAPGLGKTITTLDAMRRRAASIPAWRGLVVVEANVRAQWAAEAAVWFPEARLAVVESRADAAALAAVLADAGEDPVLAVVSYGLASTVADTLARLAAGGESPPPPRRVLDERPALGAETAAGQLSFFAFGDDGSAVCVSVEAEPAPAAGTGDAPADLGEVLLGAAWHDLAADEAACLRNAGSKQSQSLWALRERAGVAVALTGTPITRDLDDLGRLLAWSRNDRHMFDGHRLAEAFDLADPDDVAAYVRAVGPLVYRRDKSEIADELPVVDPHVVRLTPSAAESNLAKAAQAELRRVYDELMAWVRMAEHTDPSNPAYAQARAALVEARGAWLGGTQLARMALSDPAALVGSASAGAALLAGQGLIEAATRTTGTKRRWCVEECVRRVRVGEAVLVFSSFATVADGLIADLRDAGLAVGAVVGGGGKARDRMIRAFQDGDLDVLVCTASGERGLNLQRATTIVHYDLPWTPDAIAQRTGRAERIGNHAPVLTVLFPVMTGTVEERVASLVVARAVTAMQALDIHRGVDAAQTDLGRAVGGLVAEVDASSLRERESALLEITRELLAA